MLRHPSIIYVRGTRIPIILPIFRVVPRGIWSFVLKAMSFSGCFNLWQFQGVRALIFTVATIQMVARLPVPEAGLFFSQAISESHDEHSHARLYPPRPRQYTVNSYPDFRFDLVNQIPLVFVCYAHTITFFNNMVRRDLALLSRLSLRFPACLLYGEQWILVHHCLAVAHSDTRSILS